MDVLSEGILSDTVIRCESLYTLCIYICILTAINAQGTDRLHSTNVHRYTFTRRLRIDPELARVNPGASPMAVESGI